MGVIVGTVPVFKSTEADKAQAMKVVEEAAEVFGAWQTWVDGGWCAGDRRALIGECADVIQATCNLLNALGVVDMEQHMEECRARYAAKVVRTVRECAVCGRPFEISGKSRKLTCSDACSKVRKRERELAWKAATRGAADAHTQMDSLRTATPPLVSVVK